MGDAAVRRRRDGGAMPVSDDVRGSAPEDSPSECCGATSRGVDPVLRAERRTGGRAVSAAPAPALVALPGGVFTMGSDEQRYPADGEGPARAVRVGAFRIASHAVSNDDFAAFVSATGYLTTAEWVGSSFVFGGLL